MKKLTAVFCIVIAALMLSLSACGAPKTYELNFKNELSSTLHQLFISPSDSEVWGDDELIGSRVLRSGGTVKFDFEKFGGQDGGIYDIGTIDENGMNYDCYEVELHIGDSIALSGSSEAATFTVTHQDGTTTPYQADVYANDAE